MKRAPATGEVVNRPCCGRDLGPMHDHEGPSDADIERFSGVTRTCPTCKTEVYDDATVCWNCGDALGSASRRASPLLWAVVALFVVLLAVGVVRLF